MCPSATASWSSTASSTGETPVGMTFSTLAGSVGGGQQTPGFMGVRQGVPDLPQVPCGGRAASSASSGCRRNSRSSSLADLKKRFAEQGAPDLLDKIADETVATDAHAIREYHGEGRSPGAGDGRHGHLSPAAAASAPGCGPEPRSRPCAARRPQSAVPSRSKRSRKKPSSYRVVTIRS